MAIVILATSAVMLITDQALAQGGVVSRRRSRRSRSATRAADQPAAQKSADPFARALPGWLRVSSIPYGCRLPAGFAGVKLQHRLDLAGNLNRWNPDRILAVKGLGLVVLTALGMLIGAASRCGSSSSQAASGAAGFFPAGPAAVQRGPEAAGAYPGSRSRRSMDMLTMPRRGGPRL